MPESSDVPSAHRLFSSFDDSLDSEVINSHHFKENPMDERLTVCIDACNDCADACERCAQECQNMASLA